MSESLSGVSGLVTIKEAARVLGVTHWQVRYFVKTRRVPTLRVGFTVLLRLRDVEELRHS